jgi:hypothetical protein
VCGTRGPTHAWGHPGQSESGCEVSLVNRRAALDGAGRAYTAGSASSATGSPSSAFSARSSDIARHVKLGVSRTV